MVVQYKFIKSVKPNQLCFVYISTSAGSSWLLYSLTAQGFWTVITVLQATPPLGQDSKQQKLTFLTYTYLPIIHLPR